MVHRSSCRRAQALNWRKRRNAHPVWLGSEEKRRKWRKVIAKYIFDVRHISLIGYHKNFQILSYRIKFWKVNYKLYRIYQPVSQLSNGRFLLKNSQKRAISKKFFAALISNQQRIAVKHATSTFPIWVHFGWISGPWKICVIYSCFIS